MEIPGPSVLYTTLTPHGLGMGSTLVLLPATTGRGVQAERAGAASAQRDDGQWPPGDVRRVQ